MVSVQGNKKIIALGKHVIGRVEKGGNQTDAGIYLGDEQVTERVFVESIGSNVELANKLGRELQVGDEIIVLRIAKIPVWDPLARCTREIVVYGENDIIGIVE